MNYHLNMMTGEERIKRVKALYPQLTDDECKEAADRIDQYLLLAWEIWEGTKEGKRASDLSDGGPMILYRVDDKKDAIG